MCPSFPPFDLFWGCDFDLSTIYLLKYIYIYIYTYLCIPNTKNIHDNNIDMEALYRRKTYASFRGTINGLHTCPPRT